MRNFEEKLKIAVQELEFVNYATPWCVYGHKLSFTTEQGEKVYNEIASFGPYYDKRSSIQKIRDYVYDSYLGKKQLEIDTLKRDLFIEKKRKEGWRIDISSDGGFFNAWKDGKHTGGRMYLCDLERNLVS